MTDPVAILVEDDNEQSEIARQVLAGAGFKVLSFDSIAPAWLHLSTSEAELIDLFVLDRRLPLNAGELAKEELGDELLHEVRVKYPDAKIVVFTGFATIEHVQFSLQGSGLLPARKPTLIDRITVLQKHESLEFREEVMRFRKLIQEHDDIEIAMTPPDSSLGDMEKRMLRRIAFHFEGDSISVLRLSGGLTGAKVWRCQIDGPQGPIATVVAKEVRTISPPGGLSILLPRAKTTATVSTVTGLMDGRYVNILQVAGNSTYSLMELIDRDPPRAVTLAEPVWSALKNVDSRKTQLSLSEMCEPLVSWNNLASRLQFYGIQAPPPSLSITTFAGLRHGDLHPENILIDDGQAVVIDFDSESFGAGLLDPVTMLISTLVHPESPIAGQGWPNVREIEDLFGTEEFGRGHSSEAWFLGVYKWVCECWTSEREFWALSLAYAVRQLKYDDVTRNESTRERVLAIAKLAVFRLTDS